MSQDQDFLAQALPAFVSEAREQLASMEQLLLQLEEQPDDRELLDALFRCAHTVKGSAGIFGLDAVVGFTHHVETLLDKMREGVLQLDSTRSTLLLRCNDHIAHLIDAVTGSPLSDAQRQDEADLITELQASMGSAAPHTAPHAVEPDNEPDEVGPEGVWHLAAAFGADTLRNGFDPLAIVRYLATIGTLTSVACETDRIPPLEGLDPETCHLTVLMALETDATRDAIEGAFTFVREDCDLKIHAPRETVQQWVQMLDAMPDHPQLGQLLLSIGAITPAQLAAALKTQQDAQDDGKPAPRLGEILQERAGLAPEVVQAAVQKQQRTRDGGGQPVAGDEGRYIRVQASRLDTVINLLGELVIAGAGASLMANDARHAGLIEISQQMSRLIEEIRNGTLQLRMVPIGETFSRFRRVVRDTAAELGKEVALEIEGADTELDKSVVEKIADPLMHLVRNGLDHGLEPPAERTANGKPAHGTLRLTARHEAGGILISIVDDGRGINRDRVLERAWERGIVEPGVTPPDAEILNLIFEPGFSTADQITNLSGRGVGMDVVKRNIEALRGTVNVRSDWGRGTTIDIRLPLTLAIIDGFLVGVGQSKFVLPLEAVEEVTEGQDPTDAVSNDGSACYCLSLRGEILPVVDLRTLYGLDDGPSGSRLSIVVVRDGERRFGIAVDVLLGQHQTVIKPLGRMFRSLRGISGSSILGNGEVALICDVNSLGSLATMRRLAAQEATTT